MKKITLEKIIGRIKNLMEIEKEDFELDEEEIDEDETSGGGATTTTSQNAGTVKKWESGITKGPGNKTATEKWSSGRKFGPTGNYI